VRVATRTRLQLSPPAATWERTRSRPGRGDVAYTDFFTQFDDALTSSPTASPPDTTVAPVPQAQALAAQGAAVRDALRRTVYGVGTTGRRSYRSPSPTRDWPSGPRRHIQQDLATATTSELHDPFLLSVDSLNPDRMAALLADPVLGYGYRFSPFRNSFRIGLGDVEIGAKYRIVTGSRYAAAVAGTVRLPTAGRDFADDCCGSRSATTSST